MDYAIFIRLAVQINREKIKNQIKKGLQSLDVKTKEEIF